MKIVKLSRIFANNRSLRQRLEESEGKRRALQERAITVQKEWEEKLEAHNANIVQKQAARIKALEGLVEEQAESILIFSDELNKIKSDNSHLKSKLDAADRKIDEIDNSDEHGILRKQLDILLKEKTTLSIENSELKKMLGYNEQSSIPLPVSASPKKPNLTIDTHIPKSPRRAGDPMTPTAGHNKSIDSLALPLSEEEIELRNKVLHYFQKKYPETRVNQINRSKIKVNFRYFQC